MNLVKDNFELTLLNLLKRGLRPVQIAKELNTTLPRLSYHLSKLKQKGAVKKNGLVWEINPIEEVKISTQATNTQVRGHAFIWKVQPRKKYNWKQILFEKSIKYKEKGVAKVPSIEIKGKKIWLGQKNIIIYEPESFFGQNSIESRKLAVYGLLDILRQLEVILGIQIKGFRFTPNREHYSLIKNELARQCNKNGEKINVFNEKGHWMSIDNSFNLNELETLGSMENDPLGTNLQVQKWWNNQKETGFKVTPDFILKAMNGIQENQEYFAKNIETHIKAIQQLGEAVGRLTKLTEELHKKQEVTK